MWLHDIMISEKTTLKSNLSKIEGSWSTLQSEAFIIVSSGSHLEKGSLTIQNSYFKKNNMSRLIVVEDGTNVFLTNSTFERNCVRGIGQQRFAKGLMIFNRTCIDITLCQIQKNTVADLSSNLILVSQSNINMLQTTIKFNAMPKHSQYLRIMLWIDSSRIIKSANSILYRNKAYALFKITAIKLTSNSYLTVENCTLTANSLHIENIADVFISKVVSYAWTHDGIFMNTVKNVHIAYTVFHEMSATGNRSASALYFGRGEFVVDKTNLFTFDTNIIGIQSSLRSNETNFLHKAISLGFIQTEWLVVVHQKDTPFASNKFTIQYQLDRNK